MSLPPSSEINRVPSGSMATPTGESIDNLTRGIRHKSRKERRWFSAGSVGSEARIPVHDVN